MIKPGDTLIVECADNGFIVREMTVNGMSMIADWKVFNEIGFASSAGDGKPCLLTFLERHFTPPAGDKP